LCNSASHWIKALTARSSEEHVHAVWLVVVAAQGALEVGQGGHVFKPVDDSCMDNKQRESALQLSATKLMQAETSTFTHHMTTAMLQALTFRKLVRLAPEG
jgi:hypothetical protein